jgi:hypothetical protein
VHDVEEAVAALDQIGEIDRVACREHFELNFSADRMAKDYLTFIKR